MKLFEVFSKEDNTEWESTDFGDVGEVHYTDMNDRQLHVEFAKVDDIRHYLYLMSTSPMMTDEVEDVQLAAQSIIDEVPSIRDERLINVGMGVDMSPQTVNWGDMKQSLKVLGAIVKKVLRHSEHNRNYYYIFGTNEHKKAKMFHNLIKRYASEAYFVEKPEGASSYCFIIAKR